MDIVSALMGLIIFVLCALPLYLMNNSTKMREKKLLRSLTDIAGQNNAHLDQYEIGRDFAIGLDRVARMVFFYKNVDGRETRQSVRLADIAACDLKIRHQNLDPDQHSRKMIDRVQLVFTPINKKKEPTAIEIFNSEENMQVSGEVKLSEKWKQYLAELIQSGDHPKAAENKEVLPVN